MIKNIKFISFNSKKKTNETLYFFSERVSGTIGKTILSSILVMAFFSITPVIINLVSNEILISEFENNSRKEMVNKLNGQNSPKTSEDTGNIKVFDEKDLLSDILVLNELDNNSIRLRASTILQLFKDTNYDLEDVRMNKLVKPVALTWLPYELKKTKYKR